MAKEPDNLVLKLLREMRVTQQEHSVEFKRLHKEIADWAETSAQSAGFSVHANTKVNALQAEMDKRFEKFERRLKKLESGA